MCRLLYKYQVNFLPHSNNQYKIYHYFQLCNEQQPLYLMSLKKSFKATLASLKPLNLYKLVLVSKLKSYCRRLDLVVELFTPLIEAIPEKALSSKPSPLESAQLSEENNVKHRPSSSVAQKNHPRRIDSDGFHRFNGINVNPTPPISMS